VIEVEFTGERTGRRFRYDRLLSLEAPGRPGATMFGHHEGVNVETGARVYIRWVDNLSPDDRDEIERVRHAIEIARTTAVVSCPTIVQLLDYEDRRVDVYGFGDDYEVVTAAWEWGELVLLDELCRGGDAGDKLAADVDAGVGAALACLHAADLVHSDVAPNNIVRVGGVWKLADLDHVVREDEPITGLPREPYRMPALDIGDAARREMDEHGLRAVLERISRGSSS
jgi:hypothetical protein